MHQILSIVKTSIWELEEANELPSTAGNALGSSICLQGVHAVQQLSKALTWDG
jgi:hypothetical protein